MLTLVGCLAGGCGREQPLSELLPSPLRPQPVDSVAAGEIAEGEEQAFGLAIPRGMVVEARFPDAVQAFGTQPLESIANYVRARVRTSRVETGPVKTVFDDAELISDPQRRVRVEVTIVSSSKVELVVRDRTRKPAEPGLTEAERWRRAGLTPKGEVIEDQAE